MIEYEKLKIAHELTKSLEGCYVEIFLGIDEEPCMKLFDEDRQMLLISTWDIDDLITKLKQLKNTEKPKPKHNVGDIVWFTWNDDVCEGTIREIDLDAYNQWQAHISCYIIKEHQLYPSREALIDAQVAYWIGLNCEDGRHEYCDDVTGYKSICIHCDKSEFPSSIKDAFSYLTTKFEGEVKGFAQESCQHESDGVNYTTWNNTKKKCIK